MIRKKKLLGIGIVAIGAAVCAVFVLLSLWGTQTQTVLADNQSYVYAYVSSITGNEITYTELEESVVTAYLEQQEAAEENAQEAEEENAQEAAEDVKTEHESDDKNMEDAARIQTDGEAPGESSGGEMPGGERPGGESDGKMSGGESPGRKSDGEMSGGESDGERPGDESDGEMSGDESGGEMSTEDGMPSMEGGFGGGSGMMGAESTTTLIPVGATVHTQSDTETTFKRLAAGDIIKLLVETTESGEEVITEIWML